MRQAWRFILGLVAVYFCWLAMLFVHELGHMFHAAVSGARVVSVRIPLFGFSQTFVDPNPHPLFVVWGGPLWGVLIPLAMSGALLALTHRVPELLKFFAGFCLIANGAYIGLGWMMAAGDAHDLLKLGTPLPILVAFGAVCIAGGLWRWHRTGSLSFRGGAGRLQ